MERRKASVSRLFMVEASPTAAYAAEHYPNIASISSPPPFLTFFFFLTSLTAFPSFVEACPPSVSSACRGRFFGLVVAGSTEARAASGEGGREKRRSEEDAGVAERDEGALGAGEGFALRFVGGGL